MNQNKMCAFVVFVCIAAMLNSSCTAVKEYQKSKLNDGEMVLGNRRVQKSEMSFHNYREGSSGANGGKNGGGCGCN